ncbi:MAG: MBL fold metallo-hydrolase [Desulfatitalea sp.]|nr:MBL fold metallo-hydrolase [Desulfatitalea sp.]NNK00484.1 MBL fold metallo-hydrolase [Desulfatitalea sp.]
MPPITLSQVTHAEITVLVDNYSDLLLEDTQTVKRCRVWPPKGLMAEHGLAFLITVYAKEQPHTIVMDAGISGLCFNHNADLMAESMPVRFGMVTHKIDDVECMVLSHGHFDHFNGMPQVFERLKKPVPLVVHPGAFVARRIKLRPDYYVDMPTFEEAMPARVGAVLDKRRHASTIADGHILVTGEVERTTKFETGSPGRLEANPHGQWKHDSFEDDQAVAFNVKDKGLVVVGGCSHAGIINTIEHVRNITRETKIHSVMGGFHLSGASDGLIEPTVAAMKEINPSMVVPMHCTGWKAINRFAAAMPDQFVLNTVGTSYLF